MTKKDFIQWADLLARYRVRVSTRSICGADPTFGDETWWRDEIIDILRSSNPRFDSQRFQRYVDDRVERIESGRQ